MSTVSWPTSPPPWLLGWAIWRFRNSPAGQRPADVPVNVKQAAPWAYAFLKWCEWRRNGGLPENRPPLPDRIPQWGWGVLKLLNQAIPPVKPPPPPPPPLSYVDSWKLPGPLLFTAWGWATDSRFRDRPPSILASLRAAKARAIGLQIGHFQAWVPGWLRELGFKVVLWGSPGDGDAEAVASHGADGYMPQIEGASEFVAAVRALERLRDVRPATRVATVTTLAGLENFIRRPDGSSSTTEVEELIDLGCTHAFVETYKQGGPSHFPVSRMMWSAKHRGFPFFSSVLGLYHDVPVSAYVEPDDPNPEVVQLHDLDANRLGAWLAETMRSQDCAAFGALV